MATALHTALEEINKLIRISDDEKKKNNYIIQLVLDDMTKKLKEDDLFRGLYQNNFYGGSYYDDLKIKKADEYDIDLLLALPQISKPNITIGNPGYVNVELQDMESYQKAKYYNMKLHKLLNDNNFLSTKAIKSWFESIVQKAVNKILHEENKSYVIKSLVKSGPAITLQVVYNTLSFDLDLVPCFVFKNNKNDYWPDHCKKPKCGNYEFFVVPKGDGFSYKDFRLSFQKQERVLLKPEGDRKCHHIKTVIRLLKLLRDAQDWKYIKSYYIKTMALLELEKDQDRFYGKSLEDTFLIIIKQLKNKIEEGKLPYYWNEDLNLFSEIASDCFSNTGHRLERMIKEMETCNDKEQIKLYFGDINKRIGAPEEDNNSQALDTAGFALGSVIAGVAGLGIAAFLGYRAYRFEFNHFGGRTDY